MSDKPTQEQAEAAVRTLIAWAGDNPEREGLLDTPKRVTKAYKEFFAGYEQDPKAILSRTFEEVEGYDEMVLVKDIPFHSFCEHHMVPVMGAAHIGYFPDDKVVGLSKLARIVDCYGKRLQTQESMTSKITNAIVDHLQPKGVAVYINATHHCMTMRGIKKQGSNTTTMQFTGMFKQDNQLEKRFLELIK